MDSDKPDKTDEAELQELAKDCVGYAWVLDADKPALQETYATAERERSDRPASELVAKVLEALLQETDLYLPEVVQYLWACRPGKLLEELYTLMETDPLLEKSLQALLAAWAHFKADPSKLHIWKEAWECKTCQVTWYAPRGWPKDGEHKCPWCGVVGIRRMSYLEDAAPGAPGIAGEDYYVQDKAKIDAITNEVGF